MSAPTDVLVVGDRVAAIGDGVAEKAPSGVRTVDGAHHLLMPGLINGHFHSPVNHMKGSLPSLPLEIFMLYESPALEALRPTPREAYVRTMLGAVEMLRGGVTRGAGRRLLRPRPDAGRDRRRDAGLCRLRHPRHRRARPAGTRRDRQAALPRSPAAGGHEGRAFRAAGDRAGSVARRLSPSHRNVAWP